MSAPMVLIPVAGYVRNGRAVKPHVRLVRRALKFARAAHAGQTRGDGRTPYIMHPESVINILRRHGEMDAHTLAAAALHDVVEDTPTRLDEIRTRFGAAVADLVAPLTDDPNLTGEAKKHDTHLRMLRAPAAVQRVKLADKIANLQDALVQPPADWKDKHFLRYMKYAEMLGEAMVRVHPELAHELLELVQRARVKRPTMEPAERQ